MKPSISDSSSMFRRLKATFYSDAPRGALIKNSVIAMTLKLLGIVTSYSFILLITKNYGSEGWGKYSIAISFIMFCILLGKGGFDLALLKFTSSNEAKNERRITKAIYIKGIAYCFSISIFLTVLIMIFSDKIALFLFKKEYLSDYIFYASFLILLHVVLIINSEGLRGLKQNNAYLFIQHLGIYLFATIILYALIYWGKSYDLLPLQVLVVSSLFIFFISNYLWLKEIIFLKYKKPFPYPLKKILKVSTPMFMSGAMFVLLNWTDILLLGFYRIPESDIGIYAVAIKVAGIINLPLLAVSAILASSVSEQYTRGNITQLQKTIKDSTRLIFIVSVLIYLMYVCFPCFFLGFFGKDFTQGSSILIIVSTGFLISSFSGATDIILQMTNHEKLFQHIIMIASLLNIILNLILIPIYGITGSAIASLSSCCFWNFASIYYIKKRLNINSAFTIS